MSMANFASLIDCIKVNNILGECILSQPKTLPGKEAVWWTDIQSKKLFRYILSTKKLTHWATPERLCSFGFVEPETTDSDNPELIAAFENGFALYQPETASLNWIEKPEQDFKNHRFNDGRVDPAGRFWAGCMVENTEPSTDISNKDLAGLYRLDHQNVTKVSDNIRISNSLCWSLDSKTMYFADSPEQAIYAYDFDIKTGDISKQRTFITTPDDTAPDGSIVDAQGYLWNAQWGGSKVIRYSPQGEIDFVLPLPVSQPTCLTFGGSGLNTLFITTAREGLTDKQLESQPMAGDVLIYRTNFTGIPERQYIS